VKLTRSYLYAKTPVRCLKLEQDALTKFLHRMEDTDEYKQRLHFLLDSLPSLNKSSKIIKNRICRSFREQSFPAGHAMFREGEFIKNGYLIKRGEVELYSRRNLRLINYINTLKEERKIDQD
jgi:hypothetical protein